MNKKTRKPRMMKQALTVVIRPSDKLANQWVVIMTDGIKAVHVNTHDPVITLSKLLVEMTE